MDKALHMLCKCFCEFIATWVLLPPPHLLRPPAHCCVYFVLALKAQTRCSELCFKVAVLAIPKTLVFGKTPPGFSVPLCHRVCLIALNVCLSAFSRLLETQAASSGQCCAGLARLPSGLVGALWEKHRLAAGEQEQTQAGSADISGTEGSRLWAN